MDQSYGCGVSSLSYVCVKVLFELARYHAPSTVFLDEIDALMGTRGAEGEHEASRRTKTEFLIQMDGLAQSDAQVFVLAATNLPWHLDLVSCSHYVKSTLVPNVGKRSFAGGNRFSVPAAHDILSCNACTVQCGRLPQIYYPSPSCATQVADGSIASHMHWCCICSGTHLAPAWCAMQGVAR